MRLTHRIQRVEIPGGWFEQTITLENNGALTLEDYTLGDVARRTFGDSDYERTLTVRRRDMPALARALGIEGRIVGDNRARLLELVAAVVGREHPLAEFERWCAEHGIPCERWSG